MSNKLYINGDDVSKDVTDGLKTLTIDIGLNTTTKTVGKVLSNQIEVKGNTYTYLKDLFFKKCDSWQNTVRSKFRTRICGGLSIDTEIDSKGMNWCPDKERIDFVLKSAEQSGECYTRLDSELIGSNGFAEKYDFPVVYFVDQPNWIQWTLWILTIPIRGLFLKIDLALKFLCGAINVVRNILGRGDLDCNNILTGALFEDFDTWITGTGRWTVSPLIRDMIEYQAANCNLKFRSSILNNSASPYYNLSLFCLTGGEYGDSDGVKPSKVNNFEIFKANEPIYTTIQLLDELGQVFNADYRIIGNELIFERYDYFDKQATIKLLNTKDYCLDDPICISWDNLDDCAYGDYAYTDDPYDAEGNSVKKIYYREILEFNKPYNPVQKGKCQSLLNFSAARFMFDIKSFRDRSFFKWRRNMDELRDGGQSLLGKLFETQGVIRKNDLVLSSSVLSTHKLLILENNFKRNDAQIIKKKIGSIGGKSYYVYNYPMHLNEEGDYDELTKGFLYLDNPRLKKDRFKVSDFEVDCDCSIINGAINNFQQFYIQTPIGKAIPEKITIEFKETKVRLKFQNIRGFCN